MQLVSLLGLLSFLAPLLASNRPFLLIVPEGAEKAGAFGALPVGWSSPWLSGLLDEREWTSRLDLIFNAGLLCAPMVLLLGIVLRRRLGGPRALRISMGALVALAIVVGTGFTAPKPVYRYAAKIERMREGGHEVTAWYPPIERSPRDTEATRALSGPSTEYWLGADRAGRDVLVRLLYGIRISLTIGVMSVSIYIALGVLFGALAGYFRGKVDLLILRLIEVVACFPSLLLILALISIIESRSIFHVMLVIGLTGWPTVARLVRAEFLRQESLDYAIAARALGLRWPRILLGHLLPNAMAPVWVTAAFGVAGAILVESALAFLNLGDPSAVSWGQVLREGRETGELHLILAPGLLIFITVTTMNLVAEGLRDAMDPRGLVARPSAAARTGVGGVAAPAGVSLAQNPSGPKRTGGAT